MTRKTKEPATKIIDGKVFAHIRSGVYGYPSDKATRGKQ